ncbi:MAG TPA: O-antigen ligase family protein [Burkholderiales bacterium]|nr:O-antigen ligase family protein [Burkholderiales bacterium]
MSGAPDGSGALWGPSYTASGSDRWRRIASQSRALSCVALLGAFFGLVVAVAGVNALYLCVSLIGCVFILRDFRIGVVLLILLLPISRSAVFPHEIMGITGLNPLNLLLLGTLGACLLRGLSDGSLRRFVPRPLLWLYIVPIVIAGVIGSRHLNEIPPVLFNKLVEFDSVTGYIRDVVVKPLSIVVFALLVRAAVSHSEKPEKFLVPMLVSTWVMVALIFTYVLQSGISLTVLASSEEREFLSGLGMHANELGRLFAAAYALLLFTWVEAKTSAFRPALFVSMGLVVVALVLTFSRGAFLAFVIINALFLVWRRNAKTLVLFGVLAALAALAMPDAVYERVATGFGHGAESGTDTISAGRIDHIWLPLLPEIARSPVFGHGLASILWSEPMRRGPGIAILAVGHPHNAYLQALLDMGVVGLVLLCCYFAHVWKGLRALSVDPTIRPALRGFYLGAAAALASLLVSYMTDSSLAPMPEQSFLWLAIGMMYGQRRPAAANADKP